MRLRQLFYSKVGHLCRERKALLRHLTDEQDVGANIGLDDVSVRLSEVADFAEQLRANGADEYKTYMQFSSAFSRGVKPTAFLNRGYVEEGYLDDLPLLYILLTTTSPLYILLADMLTMHHHSLLPLDQKSHAWAGCECVFVILHTSGF